MLPQGALVIDTPGLREIQLWEAGGSLGAAFPEIDAFAVSCHFSDCRHDREPRCAVREAVAEGRLPAERFEHFLKLRREADHLATRQDQLARVEMKRKWKIIHKSMRNFKPGQ